MGYVRETKTHQATGTTLEVIERMDGETTEPWRFVRLECDGFERMTPRELVSLGNWLADEGKRLGKERTSSGAARKAA